MKTTHYLCILEMEYQCNNKLKKELLEFFRSLDRTLVVKDKIEELKQSILDGVAKINEQNPRCKPVKIYFEKTDNQISRFKNDFIVRDAEIVRFDIREAQLTHISSLPYYSPTLN